MNNSENDRLSVFRQMYETNFSSLVRFAQRFTSPDVAEDIVQDVFVELWKMDILPEENLASSYLFRAVRNRCINHLKQKQLRESYSEKSILELKQTGLDYFDSIEKMIIKKEDMQFIYNQIERLPEKCRQIFKLSYFEDKKSNEIAILLNISVRTVEHQLYLGLKMIRNNLHPKK